VYAGAFASRVALGVGRRGVGRGSVRAGGAGAVAARAACRCDVGATYGVCPMACWWDGICACAHV